MLICIAGKNNIAVEVLEYLYERNERYELCVTCNKTETGENSWQRSLRQSAQRLGVKEYALEQLYDIEGLIFLSLEYDRIVKPERFHTNRLYNIHFSLLPRYKGMYTSALPILNGEQTTGVTLHRIDAGIDTGDIIAQREVRIMDQDTCRDLYLKLIQTGTDLVIENIENILHDNVKSYSQSAKDSTYYSRSSIDYSDLKIDINQTANGIQRQLRAFTFREYQLPKIYEYFIIGSHITNMRSKKKPGSVLYEDPGSMMICTVDYNIILYKDRFTELLKACQTGDMNKVLEICSVEHHVNDRNEKGWTPLMVAAYNNHIEIVYYLLSMGADIGAVNNNGTNLLTYAKDAFLNTGDATLLRLFLELGLSPETKDYRGKSLWDYIYENKCDPERRKRLSELLY